MKKITIKVPAGGFVQVFEQGNYIGVVSPVDCELVAQAWNNTGGQVGTRLELSAGEAVRLDGRFQSVIFTNETAADVLAVVAVGFGTVQTSRVVGSIAVGGNNSFAGQASITTTAGAETIAANPDRVALMLVADSANAGPVWIGTDTAGQGLPLQPGGSITLPITGALDLKGSAAGLVVYVGELA